MEVKQKKQHEANIGKTLYGLTKTICNGRPRQIEAVLDKNGNLVSGKEEEQKRWPEHFKEVLDGGEPANVMTVDDDSEINEMIADIATCEPTLSEGKAAIRILKNGKVQGIDSITAELLKAGRVLNKENTATIEEVKGA